MLTSCFRPQIDDLIARCNKSVEGILPEWNFCFVQNDLKARLALLAQAERRSVISGEACSTSVRIFKSLMRTLILNVLMQKVNGANNTCT